MIETDKNEFIARAQGLVDRVTGEAVVFGMMQPRLESCDPDTLSLVVSYPALPWERNATGAVHGGMTAAMMDTAMGTLAYAITGGITPTVSLNMSYPRPAPGDGTLLISVRAVMAGRTILCISGEMWDGRAPEKPVVTAQGVFRNTGLTFPLDPLPDAEAAAADA